MLVQRDFSSSGVFAKRAYLSEDLHSKLDVSPLFTAGSSHVYQHYQKAIAPTDWTRFSMEKHGLYCYPSGLRRVYPVHGSFLYYPKH